MEKKLHLSPVRQFYEKYGALCLAVLAVVIMSLVLFSGGGAGLSNNGDFGRVMSTNSLEFADNNVPYVYQDTFRMVFRGSSGGEKLWNLLFSLQGTETYPSVHLVFIRASLAGNLALNVLTASPLSTYRVEVLGGIYLLLYAALLFLLFRSFRLPRPGADLLVKLLMLVVLCDEGYITYFNSLYSEPVQILGLLAMAVFALRALAGQGRTLCNAVCFFLSCVVYGWSKFINLPVAVLCILGFGAALALGAEKKLRRRLLAGGAACIILLGVVYLSLPGWMDYETNYNAVFFGILKDTGKDKQAEYLRELELPESMAEFADTNYYTERSAPARESGEFRAAFSRLSKVDLLFFYLRHPGYYLQKLDVAMAHSGFIRPYYLSNLDGSHPRLTFADRFGLWSWARGQLPFDTWALTGFIMLGALLLLGPLLSKKGGRCATLRAALVLLSLLSSMAYQFLMPIVTNGEGDLAKHMFAFAQWIDLLVLFLLARLGYFLCEKSPRRSTMLLSLSLAAALSAALLAPAALRAVRAGTPRSAPEIGSYVALGQQNGSSMLWQVAQRGDGSFLLLAAERVAFLPFSGGGTDGFGSSRWEDSSLRSWLNGDFLSRTFSANEHALLRKSAHTVLLSGSSKTLADTGYNDFFAFHVPAYSDRGMDIAYSRSSLDLAFLPDIRLLAELSRRGVLSGDPCWMDTPYYNNGSMLRILGADGYFYMRDAAERWGVRPVVALNAPSSWQGSGTVSDPFVPVV